MNTEMCAIIGVILILTAPCVSAVESDYQYDDDGWLIRLAGPERLSLGDEFACHGMPDVNPLDDPNSVAACISYLNERIHASKWGENPLTFGLPDYSPSNINSENLSDALISAGIHVVDNSDFGPNDGTFNSFEVNAGSLEKSVASVDAIRSASNDEGIVVLSWIAEMEDLNVRKDSDVVSWIEGESFWFTTPGEIISSKSHAMISHINSSDSSVIVEQPNAIQGLWNTPGNSLITAIDSEGAGLSVLSVSYSNGTALEQLDSMDRHLSEGWRFENGSMHLSLMPGSLVTIQFNSNQSLESVQVSNNTFNGLIPLIVYGEHVTDLFEWSSGFKDSPIRFTWLIEPRSVTQMNWILPIIAGLVGIITVFYMRRLIQSDDPSPELFRTLFESE
ncbi:MAG TPA: hypothetical protein QF555_06800 [Candidatus Thalassarchaeaceae archaeon]|nr:hypothetical protein [Candidatus Thalassarchaeaceae archaeon]